MPPIRAVIFDMDGLLIDTEPIWRQAEVEVLASVGVRLTPEQGLETMGVRIAEVVDLWYRRHPWTGPSKQQVVQEIEDAVIAHVMAEGEPNPGVREAIATVREARLPMAIASSSSEQLIQAVVDRLGIGEDIVIACSGVNEARGKPHPDVFLTAARRLAVSPENCLALEDSPNGVLSAKAAGMLCIAVPDRNLIDDPRYEVADIRLRSLEDFTPQLLASLQQNIARA